MKCDMWLVKPALVVIAICVCSISTESVIRQVKKLFRGHEELILGLNVFLPKVGQSHVRCNVTIVFMTMTEALYLVRGKHIT